eukprot:scaffold1.g5481.t1
MYPIPPSAETQGRTEQYIGTWLQQRRREDVILATKVSGYGRQSYLRDDGSLPRVDARNIRESVDKSLARLQTDHIDLLQIHWPDRYVPLFGAPSYDAANEREAVPFEEQLAGLEAVIRAGKVRFVGVSNETSYGVMSFVQAARQGLGLPMIVSIQNSYSLLVRGSFETGKYVAGNEEAIANARFNLFQGYMKRYRQSLACEAATAYVEVAQRHGLTPTQLALAFVSSRWFVSSIIIGATSLEQLKENIGTFDVRLSPEALADIDKVFRRYRDPATCLMCLSGRRLICLLLNVCVPRSSAMEARGRSGSGDLDLGDANGADFLSGEVTIDQIHSLSSKRARGRSNCIAGCNHRSPALVTLSGSLPMRSRPVPHGRGSESDFCSPVAPLPRVGAPKKASPAAAVGKASSFSSSKSPGAAGTVKSPGGGGKLPRVAMMSRPATKREEAAAAARSANSSRPGSAASRTSSLTGGRTSGSGTLSPARPSSAGAAAPPRRSPVSSSTATTRASPTTPARSTASTGGVASRAASATGVAGRTGSAPGGGLAAHSASGPTATSSRATPTRSVVSGGSFTGVGSSRIPRPSDPSDSLKPGPSAGPSRAGIANGVAARAGPASPTTRGLGAAGPASPTTRGAAGASPAGRGYAASVRAGLAARTASATARTAAAGGGKAGAAGGGAAKPTNARKALEDIMTELQDVKRQLGIPVGGPAGPAAEATEAEAMVKEEAAEAEAAERRAQEEAEAAAAAAKAAEETEAAAKDAAEVAARVAAAAVEAAVAAADAEAAEAAKEEAAAAEAEAKEELPTSTRAAVTGIGAAAAEVEGLPADAVHAKRACACCTIM